MTATTTKSGQKRLDSCALHTRRWAKIAGNPRKNTCTLHETATPVDAANAELENYGKIRQLLHKTKILGKYRLNVSQLSAASSAFPTLAKTAEKVCNTATVSSREWRSNEHLV